MKNEFPYVAGIIFTREEANNKAASCTGVQISKRHILTAAHCVANVTPASFRCDKPTKGNSHLTSRRAEHYTIYAGSECLNPVLCDSPISPYYVSKTPVFYNYFNPCTFYGDIAVIELDRDINPSEGKPICMPGKDELLARNFSAVGYGIDPKRPNPKHSMFNWLQVVQQNLSFEDKRAEQIVTSTKHQSLCGGDSGAPLVQVNGRGKDVLVGITSGGTKCNSTVEDRVGYFTDVRKKLDWICEQTGVCPI